MTPKQKISKATLSVIVALTIIGLALLTLVASLGYRTIESNIKHDLAQQLRATISTNKEAVGLWWQEKIKDSRILVNDPRIRKDILRLIKTLGGEAWPREKILEIPEILSLKNRLGLASRNYGFSGFVLFDRNGYQILSLLEEATGSHQLSQTHDFVQKVLSGQSLVTVPFKSEIPLPDQNGTYRHDYPTMFVAVPVKEKGGKIAGALSFRIRPEGEFNRLMSLSRFGGSGETYAFDRQGTLLSESRFRKDLISAGLLTPEPGSMSMLNIRIVDPGGNLAEGYTPQPDAKHPLTRMAASATQGHDGINMEGYRDYRGVTVVGAWAWMADKGFGMTTEIDAREAFAPLRTLLTVFSSLFLLLLVTLLFAILFYMSKLRSKRRLELQTELTDQKDRMLGSLMNTMVDAVITIDQYGTIKSFNSSAEKIFGYSATEVLGRNVKMLMEGEHREKHDEYLKRYMETRVPHIIGFGREVTGLRKDGSHFDLDLSVSQNVIGEEIMFLGICRDISERKKQEAETKRAHMEAEAANKAKTQFLARMSHELRTPLNAILGFGQLLELDPALDKPQKKSIKQIVNSGHHLLALINDVLDLSRIESDAIFLSPEPMDLSLLVRELLTLTQSLAHKNHIRLVNEIPEKLPYNVMGDRTRVKQILLNLTSNAIKYNRENGTVTLSCRSLNEDTIEISVADTGPGINPEKIDKLFIPFERLGAENTPVDGTGIGLSICQDLARKMGGDILVDSQPGRGCSFKVLLPKSKQEPAATNRVEGKDFQQDSALLAFGKASILYIEDNPSNLNLVTHILADFENLTLISAMTAKEGMQRAMEDTPDLILLDIHLPDMNGLDLLKILQRHSETCDIPVLGLSANALQSEIDRALEMGMKDYITKPIDIDGFLNKLASYLPVAK